MDPQRSVVRVGNAGKGDGVCRVAVVATFYATEKCFDRVDTVRAGAGVLIRSDPSGAEPGL